MSEVKTTARKPYPTTQRCGTEIPCKEGLNVLLPQHVGPFVLGTGKGKDLLSMNSLDVFKRPGPNPGPGTDSFDNGSATPTAKHQFFTSTAEPQKEPNNEEQHPRGQHSGE